MGGRNMLHKTTNTQEVDVMKYTDSKGNVRMVKHSIICDTERKKLAEDIADELYRIFTGDIK